MILQCYLLFEGRSYRFLKAGALHESIGSAYEPICGEYHSLTFVVVQICSRGGRTTGMKRSLFFPRASLVPWLEWPGEMGQELRGEGGWPDGFYGCK